MQIQAEALVARLDGPSARGGALPPVVWVHGDEPLLAIEAADAVRRAARAQGFTERDIIQVDRNFRAASLQARTNALSLFAERRLVEVRFGAAKPGKESCNVIAEAVAALATDADTRLLVTSPRVDWKLVKAGALSAVERAGWLVSADPVDRQRLPDWIGARLARQDQRADAETLALLAERTEGNLLAARQEIMKLGLLCPPGALPPEQVRAAVLDVSRFDVNDAVDAMLAGDLPRAMRAVDGLRAEGEPPQKLAWWLADAARKLARLHDLRARGRSPQGHFMALRIFRAQERLYLSALARVDARTARRALLQAAEIDRIGKGVGQGDVWAAIAALVAAIAGAPPLTPLQD